MTDGNWSRWREWFTGRRLIVVAAVGAAVLVLCCCGLVMLLTGDGDDPGETDGQASPGIPTGEATDGGGGGGVPGSPTGPETPGGPTGDEPGNGGGGGVPAGDCAAYVDSGDWCMDWVSDYDCEGGTGDGPGYAPPEVRLLDPAVDPFGLDRDGDGVGCEEEETSSPEGETSSPATPGERAPEQRTPTTPEQRTPTTPEERATPSAPSPTR